VKRPFLIAVASTLLASGAIAFANPASAPAATPPAPPAASTTELSVITDAQFNSGDTAWMLTSSAIVLI
jgi:hypothetical protein